MVEITTTQSVQHILNNYDINDLLTRTIPKDYHISETSLEIYKKTTKFDTPTTIELNDEATSKLKSFTDNYPNYAHTEVLSYLIDMVCDLSKIHTKDIATALNKYYEIASSDPKRHTNILNAFAVSLYYQDLHTDSETGITTGGLDEESLAYFLISSERTRIIKIKKKSGPKPYSSSPFHLYSTSNKNVHTPHIISYQVAVRQLFLLPSHILTSFQPHHQLYYELSRVLLRLGILNFQSHYYFYSNPNDELHTQEALLYPNAVPT